MTQETPAENLASKEQDREKANKHLLQITIYGAAFPGLVLLGLLNSGHEYIDHSSALNRCLQSSILSIFISSFLHIMILHQSLNDSSIIPDAWLSAKAKYRIGAIFFQILLQSYLISITSMMLHLPLVILGAEEANKEGWYMPLASDIANFFIEGQ